MNARRPPRLQAGELPPAPLWRASVVLAAALVALSCPQGVGAQTIYRWVDKEGKVHYGDCPPRDCKAEIVAPAAAPGPDSVRRAQEQASRERQKAEEIESGRRQADAAAEKSAAERQAAAVDRKQRCIRARSNLYALERDRPVFTIDAKGERVYLGDADRTTEIARQKRLVAEYCDD